jgi:WD40 repeat protein
MKFSWPAACVYVLLGIGPVVAQAPAALTIDREPVLRVAAGGPTAFVNALAFSPVNQTLYAGGFDKVLHAWTLNNAGRYVAGGNAFRLPVGPGIDGTINSVAVSPDGVWLAVAGRGTFQHGGVAGFREQGIWVPTVRSLSTEMWQDLGTIYLFNTRTGAAQQLRGHRGPVSALAFTPARAGNSPVLASAGREYDDKGYSGAVRIWDAERGAELGHLLNLPDLAVAGRTRLHRIAPWHGGPQPKQVRVAIAWEDSKLRIWDVERGAAGVHEADDGDFNTTAAYLAGRDQLLTTCVVEGRGQLRLWNLPAGKPPVLAKQLPLPAGHRPRALEDFPNANRAAVITEALNDKQGLDHVLHLVDLGTMQPAGTPLRLWTGSPAQPVLPALAVSGDGRFLAVGGNREHDIHVFSVAALLKNQDGRQRLQGVGTTVRGVAFVRNGANRGLLLDETNRPISGSALAKTNPGAVLLDFNRRLLNDDLQGWTTDAPSTSGWSVVHSEQKDPQGRVVSRQLQVMHDKQALGLIRLKAQVFPTAQAILPPLQPGKAPLVAVASLELGQPYLGIYDGASGELLNQLTGHVNRIHALNFSGDGRLLVSAAADQMTCVWSVADLDFIRGRKGMLRGLVFENQERAGGLLLAQLDGNDLSAANRERLKKAGVQEGDVVEGAVEQGKLKPAGSLREFYDGIVTVPPGKPVTLRVRKRGDVALLMGPVISEHKPLFSVFLTGGDKAEERQWIGWSPVGPYDASGRDAERLLGWHKNTGEAQRPASFALAQEHREQNRKPDILKYLAAHGNAGQAFEAWQKDHPDKAREPKMTFWINEPGLPPELDMQGRILLRQPPQKLLLSIHEMPLGKVRVVRWQLDGGRQGTFTADSFDRKEWTAELENIDWKRGEHRLRVTLTTEFHYAQDYPRELVLNFQPPRPAIKAVGMVQRVTNQPDFRLQAQVVPGEGEPAEVRVVHRHDGKEVSAEKPVIAKAELKIDQLMKLQPGLNQIRVTARNQGAAANDAAEADVLAVEVLYKTARPLISLNSIQTAIDAPPLRIDADQPDKPIVVDVPKIVLNGEVEALDDLTTAAWVQGGQRQPLALNKQKRLPIKQEIALAEPGKPVQVRFLAKTAASEEAERTVTLVYHPRLPEVRLSSPVDGQPFVQGKDAQRIKLEGRVVWPEARHAFSIQVLVNGKEQGEPESIDLKTQSFTGLASLLPGENAIQLRLKNPWRESLATRVAVTYRRPPRVVSLTGPAQSAQPFARITAVVETPKDTPLTFVRLKGKETPAEGLKLTVKPQGELHQVEITFDEVPLQRGGNRIEFQAANPDGWSLTSSFVNIQVLEPKQDRAEVSMLNPTQDLVVEASHHAITLQVRSDSPLKRVELERNGEKVYQKIDFTDVRKSTDNIFDIKLNTTVPLLPGSNTLKATVLNAGGEAISRPVVLTYQSEPVRLSIEQLWLGDKPVASSATEGTLKFSVALDRVRVQGKVLWGAQNDQEMAKITHVRVCVNGFQQSPAALEPAAPGRRLRTFKTDVLLTRAKGNQIAVKLTEFAQEVGSQSECLVDCAHPGVEDGAKRQAHLLVIDTSPNQDEKRVLERIYQGIGAAPAGENRFTRPGFADGGRVYGPLVGEDVTPEKVYVQMLIIKRTLRKRAEAGAVNDVVLLYFRGGESIDTQGHFFRTSDSERDPELRWSGIPSDYFKRFFGENLGAHIVLLDVVRDAPAKGPTAAPQPGKDRVTNWAEDPNVAVLRFAWTDRPQSQLEEARLLTGWTAAIRQARTLRDVSQRLGTQFTPGPPEHRTSVRFNAKLTYYEQVPVGLEEFPIGRP